MALSTPWSRGKRPVISVVHSAGPSVGRSVASAPRAPRRASRASPADSGGSAVRSPALRPSIPTTKTRRDGCAASNRTGNAFAAGAGAGIGRRASGTRERRGRREDGEHAGDRALVLRVEPAVEPDRDEHRRGSAHHHGGQRQRPQRFDRERVAVGHQVGPVEPGHRRERQEREHGEEGPVRDRRADRAPPAQRAPGRRQQHERQRSDRRPGKEQARGERHGLVAQPQRGIQVEGECRERHGADRGREGRTREHPAGHGTQAYPKRGAPVDARAGAAVGSAACPPTGPRPWSAARGSVGRTSC